MTLTSARAAAILVIAAALTFWNGLSAPFLYDDTAAITGNLTIRDVGDPIAVLSPPSETPVGGRPLVNLSFALNYAAGGLDPTGYHAVNLALHLLCAFVLFALISRTTGGRGLALASALLWMVHPINSEIVDYATQRTEVMMALALLLTLWWSSGVTTPAPTRSKQPARPAPPSHPALAVAACAAGMLCKETMVVAPLAVVFYDRVFVFGSFHEAFAARGRFYLALASTWLVLAVMLLWHGQTTSAGFAHAHTTPWQYFLNQPAMILRYLRLMVWPVPLVLVYGWPRVLSFGDVWPAFAVVTALFVATVALIATRPRIGFLCGWFFLLLGPTSSFMPIATEVAAERRMYLPSMAVIVLAVAGGAVLLRRFSDSSVLRSRVGAGLVALAALVLAARTVDRNADYGSTLAMSETIIDRWPSPVARQLRGAALSGSGRHDEAIQLFREAESAYPLARYFLGAELVDTGRADEGIAKLQQFIHEEPALEATGIAHSILADVYSERHAFDQAIPHYRAIVAAQPRNGAAWTGLGVALASTNRLNEAVTAFQQAVAADPANAQYRQNLARALQMSGRGSGQ